MQLKQLSTHTEVKLGVRTGVGSLALFTAAAGYLFPSLPQHPAQIFFQEKLAGLLSGSLTVAGKVGARRGKATRRGEAGVLDEQGVPLLPWL